MPLLFPDGSRFTSGVAACWNRPIFQGERVNKLIVQIGIYNRIFEAAVDTGGIYLILDPEIASAIALDPADSIGSETINIRGVPVSGSLHRIQMDIPALEGTRIGVDVTAFIPRVSPGVWSMPSVLGWHCCLERIRFAVDPLNERFYFGSTDN